MDFKFSRFLLLLGFSLSLLANAQVPARDGETSQNAAKKRLPTGVLLVKGAWASGSDSTTPIPEGGGILNHLYRNDYFGLTYGLPQDWTQKYAGPPPSDSGAYVLAQIRPADSSPGGVRGSILISAQDLFFTLTQADSALALINYTKDHLSADDKVERPPTEVHIANHSFVRFDYFSPVAELHWYVLATQIRCHVVQFVFTSRDTDLLNRLIQQMNTMKLPAEADLHGATADDCPVCLKDYASGENVIEREDPVFTERAFNPVPVRIIIDTQGKVRHIHFLSAFPSQAKSITDALQQWRFRTYLRDGKPAEVETGILFGRPPQTHTPPARAH
ncbi:MAG TPA: hypothetical protein VEJ67_13530 [Candidatus Cybelea sp.]|nr:hypothetical protein [Candidatus Cybelea sp.]